MKKYFLLPVVLLGLLTSCNKEKNSTKVPSDNTSNTSDVKKTVLERFDAETEFYRISTDYYVTYNEVEVGNGIETKSVFIGKDADGFDSKVEFRSGTISSLAGLEDNSRLVSNSYSIYYTPTKTYTSMADRTYKVTAENHDIKPYSVGFDFEKIQDQKEEVDGYNTITSGKINDTDVAAFFGANMKDTSDITNVTVSVTMSTLESYLDNISLTFTKKGSYKVTQNFTYSSINSSIYLPA
jgi:hypothetical protein